MGKQIKVEWLPVVDEEGNVTGKVDRKAAHAGEKILHPVIHLHLLDNQSVLLQKRSVTREVHPGKWDMAVGGHVAFNETLEEALKRESAEEVGLKDFSAKLFHIYRWEDELQAELTYVFVAYGGNGLSPDGIEVDEARFWTKNQIEKNLGEELFTPGFEYEYSLLKNAGLI